MPQLGQAPQGEKLDHVTYNALSEAPDKVLEFDLMARPAEPPSHILALFATEEPTATDSEANSTENKAPGFLEKSLSDFFDIQIFSTVYFGSQHQPH